MTVPFPEYAKIKNKYCLCYFGPNRDYVKQLKYVRPLMEKELPGTLIYLCCRDDFFNIFEGEDYTLPMSEIQKRKKEFAYIRELTYNMEDHPILAFLEESKINLPNSYMKFFQ